jgi:integrating conjugative element protein (TIGR03761 family)
VQGSLDAVQRELAATEAIAVTTATSVKPVRTPLRFSNPYAFRGAQLLATYDRLVRLLLTARYIGQLTSTDSEQQLGRHARALRHAFLSPVGYHLTGVMRTDVRQATARSAQAVACMGEVPADILDGAQRAPYAPARPMPPSAWARHTIQQTTPSRPLPLTRR